MIVWRLIVTSIISWDYDLPPLATFYLVRPPERVVLRLQKRKKFTIRQNRVIAEKKNTRYEDTTVDTGACSNSTSNITC